VGGLLPHSGSPQCARLCSHAAACRPCVHLDGGGGEGVQQTCAGTRLPAPCTAGGSESSQHRHRTAPLTYAWSSRGPRSRESKCTSRRRCTRRAGSRRGCRRWPRRRGPAPPPTPPPSQRQAAWGCGCVPCLANIGAPRHVCATQRAVMCDAFEDDTGGKHGAAGGGVARSGLRWAAVGTL
jgi:hypothetical protein